MPAEDESSAGEEEEDSVNEDTIEDAPICIQGTLRRLVRKRAEMNMRRKSLKGQLRRAQHYTEELRLQIEELNAKLAVKTKKTCQKCIKFKRQMKALKAKLKSKEVEQEERGTQTTEEDLRQAAWIYQFNHNTVPRINSGGSELSLAESIREAAETALNEQGMVLEKTSGLYYDYKTGYYYDADKSLYYDGNTGNYLKYDEESKLYTVDSCIPPEEVAAQRELQARDQEMKLHRVRKKRKRSKEDGSGKEGSTDNKEEAPSLEKALAAMSARLQEDEYTDEEDDDGIQESSIPCIRLVVKHTEDERVKAGFLYIVTCKGGTVGSKGPHEVLLPDLGCSKLHAKISFNSSDCSYSLRDLGSRNGTWINGKRLSAPKERSKDVQIGHRTCVQIGKTKLVCHVHPGKETCLECEPGQQKTEEGKVYAALEKKEARRVREVKELKRSYGIGVGLQEERKEIPGFIDRAEERRIVHGVDPVNAKTETASVDQAIGTKNKGYRLLQKMGWEGGGLGRSKDGIEEPVEVEARARHAGLGTNHIIQSVSAREKKKNEIWKKTQKRFSKVPVLDAFKPGESEEDEEKS